MGLALTQIQHILNDLKCPRLHQNEGRVLGKGNHHNANE